jgi:hypothetical protein
LLRDLLEQSDSLRDRQWSLDRKLNYLLTYGLDYDGDEFDRPVNVADLQSGWREFLRQGGVSAEDFDRYLQGERLGNVRTKRHLRLVSNKTPMRRRLRAVHGNDAA